MEKHTRPSEASSSLTGHSRTEATKQKDAGSFAVAPGYQTKSSIGEGSRNVWRLRVAPLSTACPKGQIRLRVIKSHCTCSN